MTDPRFSAPELRPDQVERARAGKKWPRNRDIDLNADEKTSQSQENR
jgi:hypothetical protein